MRDWGFIVTGNAPHPWACVGSVHLWPFGSGLSADPVLSLREQCAVTFKTRLADYPPARKLAAGLALQTQGVGDRDHAAAWAITAILTVLNLTTA